MGEKDSPQSTANKTYARMTRAPVPSLVLKLGIPTMMSMLVTALYNTASTYYISYLGTSPVGAMGVVFALQTISQAMGIMIGQGCASQTSRLLGEKAYSHANRLACVFACQPLGKFRAFPRAYFCKPLWHSRSTLFRAATYRHGGNRYDFAVGKSLRAGDFACIAFYGRFFYA